MRQPRKMPSGSLAVFLDRGVAQAMDRTRTMRIKRRLVRLRPIPAMDGESIPRMQRIEPLHFRIPFRFRDDRSGRHRFHVPIPTDHGFLGHRQSWDMERVHDHELGRRSQPLYGAADGQCACTSDVKLIDFPRRSDTDRPNRFFLDHRGRTGALGSGKRLRVPYRPDARIKRQDDGSRVDRTGPRPAPGFVYPRHQEEPLGQKDAFLLEIWLEGRHTDI